MPKIAKTRNIGSEQHDNSYPYTDKHAVAIYYWASTDGKNNQNSKAENHCHHDHCGNGYYDIFQRHKRVQRINNYDV